MKLSNSPSSVNAGVGSPTRNAASIPLMKGLRAFVVAAAAFGAACDGISQENVRDGSAQLDLTSPSDMSMPDLSSAIDASMAADMAAPEPDLVTPPDFMGPGSPCAPNEPDSDNDNVNPGVLTLCDRLDNCPNQFNPTQSDLDGDGLGDVCDENPNDQCIPNGCMDRDMTVVDLRTPPDLTVIPDLAVDASMPDMRRVRDLAGVDLNRRDLAAAPDLGSPDASVDGGARD